jgi:hypothetical protein
MTGKVMEAHEGIHFANILVYKFEHIAKEGKICPIQYYCSAAWDDLLGQRCS